MTMTPELQKAVRNVQTAHAKQAKKRALDSIRDTLLRNEHVMDIQRVRGVPRVAMVSGVVVRIEAL